MKPFHRNNTLFFFKLYPRTNGSLLFSGKTGFGLSSSEAFIWGTSPTSTPFLLSELLRGGGGGVGRWTGASNLPQVGTHGLGLGILGLGTTRAGGIMKGQPLSLGSQWGRSQGNHSARTLSNPKAGAALPSAFQHIIHSQGVLPHHWCGWEEI